MGTTVMCNASPPSSLGSAFMNLCSYIFTVAEGFVAACLLLFGCTQNKNQDASRSVPSPKSTNSIPDTASESTEPAPDTDTGATPEEQAEALLAQMTLAEKIDYIGGDRSFYIRPVPHLGIPEIKMSDGPVGCRNWGPSTAYPATVGIAAAFDVELAEQVGRAIGRDCRARGVHILLAPGVNIHRSPLGGRNFEYM